MENEEALRNARKPLIDLLSEKSSELRPLIQGIAYFDKELKETTDILGIITGGSNTDSTGAVNTGMGSGKGSVRNITLRPDEFTGKTYFQSAKSYLERIGHAVSIMELLDALKRGGSPVGGKTPKKTLYISLVRSREFYPIPGQKDFIGLREWYSKK